MPAIVDHHQRRAEIAACAAKLIADGGIEAATVREVAASAGYSTKVVSHYFENKKALLLETYSYAAARSSATTLVSQGRGGCNVTTYLMALLPTNPERRENWKVWFAFWAYATADDSFANEQRNRVEQTRMDIEDVLRRDVRFKAMKQAKIRDLAQYLITDIIGIAIQAVFDPESWTEAEQIKPIVARLKGIS